MSTAPRRGPQFKGPDGRCSDDREQELQGDSFRGQRAPGAITGLDPETTSASLPVRDGHTHFAMRGHADSIFGAHVASIGNVAPNNLL